MDDELPDELLELPELESPELPEFEAEESELDTFFFLPVLKSVSYQPPPERRNPAADTSLLSADSSQLGQTFNGSSEIFWSFSSLCSQASH